MKASLNSVLILLLFGVWIPAANTADPPKKTLLAIAVGLNRVDPARYEGWSGPLVACEKDADDMLKIAASQGYETSALKTKDATRQAFRDAITGAAARLKAGDTLVLSYSGHGGQVRDTNGDEADGLDETWCLFDGEIVDDELALLWTKFQPGVRIVVYSDSCHSGSVIKNLVAAAIPTTERFRIMPPAVADKLRAKPEHQDLDKGLPSERSSKSKTEASVLLISGCQDDQLSRDGDDNGLFTGKLIATWNSGGFKGSYRKFYEAIRAVMPSNQKPNFDKTGKADPTLEAERPWTTN
jgi:metacaspase-1